MILPIFQDVNRNFMLMQTKWAQILQKVLVQPFVGGNTLESVSLAVGANTVNHLLGRPLRGWFLVRKRAQAGIYDTQDSNPNPEITLLLTSDAAVTVDLFVY